MKYIALREKMVALCKSLFERGYATGGAGNVSVITDDGYIIATPTGSCLGRLEAERLSLLNMNGEHLDGDKPSKEIAFHIAIYQEKPEQKAVVHLHSTYLTALSCLKDLNMDNAIKAFTPYYVMRVGALPVIPYFRPGSPKIVEAVQEKAKKYSAILMENHGVIVSGKNLEDAIDNSEELEETAKLQFLLSSHSIRYLTDDEVNDLKGRGK